MMSKRTRPLKPLFAACGIAALLWISCAGIESAQQIRDAQTYEKIAPAAVSTAKADAVDAGATVEQASWDTLTAANPDCAGWIEIESTPISYPLVQANKKAPDYWLKHDFWGSWSSIGCPYIDSRCNLGSKHLLVFGHHIGSTDLMFGPLAKAYRQDVFSSLGDAVIRTSDGKTLCFEPLLALRVDQSFAAIQTFDWEDSASFVEWIRSLEKENGAVLNHDGAEADSIQQVLTLVTCSNDTGGMRERTLVVFAR